MWWNRRSGLREKRGGFRRTRFFEHLESRQLMAVSTALSGGWLTITGDTANDNIAIVGTANPGEFVVFGRDGTTVNGVANGSVTIPGVTGNMTVNLNGGDDVLSMDNVFVARIITIDTAEGNDAVALGAHSVVSPAGNLTINTGAGNDQVAELSYAVFVGGAHALDLGAGDDTATLVGVSAVGGTHGALHNAPPVPSISVRGRDGNDSLLAIGVTARLELRLEGEAGSNSLALLTSAADLIGVSTTSGNLYLDTNFSVTHVSIFTSGDSSISIFQCQCTTMYVTPGPGNNFIHIYGNAVNGPAYTSRVNGAPKTPIPPLFSLAAARSSSDTPLTNQNTVLMSYNLFTQANVTLGDGDDSLSLTGNFVTNSAYFDGGLGVDTLTNAYNVFGAFVLQNFP